MKTSELIGPALAYAVGIAEGCKVEYWHTKSVAILFPGAPRAVPWNPHSNWSQGGPIIEREGINVALRYGLLPPNHVQDVWDATIKSEFYTSSRPNSGIKKEVIASGPYPLVAAMRCYVSSKLGDEVEIPEELK